MTTRFKTLSLIGKRHRVAWVKGLHDGSGVEVYGLYHERPKLIEINDDQTHDDERETMLHEIMHALEAQMNASIPEAKLRQLAVGLYAALKDNPKLVAYLLEEEADDAELGNNHHAVGGSAGSSGSGGDGPVVRHS